jgi:hypothetical protein
MGTTHIVTSGNCPSLSCAINSSLLMLTVGPWDQFPRWRRSRRRLSVCSVLRCPDLWLQCSVSFVYGLKKTDDTRITSLCLCVQILSSELHSQTPSSCIITDQSLQPYTTTRKITMLCIYLYIFRHQFLVWLNPTGNDYIITSENVSSHHTSSHTEFSLV